MTGSKAIVLVLVLSAPWSALAAPAKAVSGARSGEPTTSVQNTREVVLDEKAVGKVIAVRTAGGVLTTVEFPEDIIGRPACGDCEDGQGPEGDALYRLEVSGQGRYLTIRPNAAARPAPGADTSTTILVRLEHATLTLYVERGERTRADTRVVFSYPDRAAESEYLRVERAKIEAEAGLRIESAVTARFLQAFAGPHHCENKSSRTRDDDVVLEVREMCYFDRDVVITFTIENRARTPLELASVVVNKGTNKRQYVSQKTIEFGRPSTAVVALHLPDGEQVKGPYEITVYESGGKERVITLSRLEF